ncbi:MAG: nucleotidyl transferase AbiEii/AbiGii toxin family protein [Bacteroidales bacterium]|nr:nucleotidyl transferase AbiEii/AbiGii toxin family protein [Bacteroidales bacterium]
MIEKTIRAFSLLEALAMTDLPFCFKGGSCTMLHMGTTQRLSTDIDIICPPGTDIESRIGQYASEYGFYDVQLVDRKSKHNVPKTHAKYFYEVTYQTRASTDKVLLDVLFEDLHYKKTVYKPITSPFLLEHGEKKNVRVPAVEDILGDKLTAFAPHTTGIPFFKIQSSAFVEIVKQMFDIASLFDLAEDWDTVGETFRKFAIIELGYRNLEQTTFAQILEDVIATAECIAMKGQKNPEEFAYLMEGIRGLGHFVISGKYTLDRAIKDAGKAAYIAASLMHNSIPNRRFVEVNPDELNNLNIGNCLSSKLNKLKKNNPEAFFYWSCVDQLL